MVILRQRSYSKRKFSIYETQENPDIPNLVIHNKKKYQNGLNDAPIEVNKDYRKLFNRLGWRQHKGVRVGMKDILIRTHEGSHTKDPRHGYHIFLSNKSPKEAYKDWLESKYEAQKSPHYVPNIPSDFSDKEVKEAIRKGVKRRNIKKAAIIVSPIAGAGTYIAAKAINKKNKDKK